MRKFLLALLCLPSLAFSQTQIGPASGAGAGIQIGGNQPGVSSIQGQTGDFTLTGSGFTGCTTTSGVTTCTFDGTSTTLNGLSGDLNLLGDGSMSVTTLSPSSIYVHPLRDVVSYANFSSLVGAFTDSGGNVIQPVYFGNGPSTFAVPVGATQLQLGVNDDEFTGTTGSWTVSVNGVNYTVLGTAAPWLHTAGINAQFPTGVGSSTSPTVVPIANDRLPITVTYVSGTVTQPPVLSCSGSLTVDAGGIANCSVLASIYGNSPGLWTAFPPSTNSAGLADPGSNGFVYRTALNTTAVGTLSQLIAAYWSDTSCSTNPLLQKDGTCAVNSGTPGGTSGHLQYNNAGAFGGDTSTTDGAGNVTVTTISTTGGAGQGGTFDATEGTAPSAAAGHDLLYADSTSHCIKLSNNGGSFNCIGTGGTVTSVATGTGLTGGPVTSTGTISCVDATSGAKGCVQVDGTTITATAGVISAVGSAPAWSALTNPTGNLALTMGADTSAFTFNAATGAGDLFKWTDTASNTGTGILGHFTTASGSTEIPWQADANGCGWRINSSGSLESTCSSGVAAGAVFGQGTIPGNGTNAVTVTSPASVTSYRIVLPGAHPTATSTFSCTAADPSVCTFAAIAGSHQWACEPGLGDGLNAITAGTYLQTTCMNTTGSTVTITGVKCYADAGTPTMNVAGNTLGALLTGAVTCSSSFAAGTQSTNVLLTNGDYLNFTFVAGGTAKQTTWVVTGTY